MFYERVFFGHWIVRKVPINYVYYNVQHIRVYREIDGYISNFVVVKITN